MPPFHPPRSDDGPACRVCGCTQHNACATLAVVLFGKKRRKARETTICCSWVETSTGDIPRWLCSACSGTAGDMAEVIGRCCSLLEDCRYSVSWSFLSAARQRYEARQALD